tara:strand:+ start:2003 stop:2401 length:399 start_codon:yes stop_codon:yes gene_type:complete
MVSGKVAVLLGIASVAVGATFLDRLDHRQFAFSPICRNKDILSEGGRFAAFHCMYHSEQWSAPGKWLEHGLGLLVPDVGDEVRFAAGHAILNALSWINWFIAIAVAVCSYRAANILYSEFVVGGSPPKYKCI